MAEENLNGAVPPKVTPGAPRPITVRLKPVAPKTETQRAAEVEAKEQQTAEPMETVITAIPGRTARVPIPTFEGLGGDADKPEGVATSATVKLRPVRVPVSPAQPPFTSASHAHKPGSDPLPPGPKPPSEAQVQAAKSKTSRISLEAAIGVAPDGPMSGGSPKTIRLKRPAKLDGTGTTPSASGGDALTSTKSRTAPIGKTSRIPDGALPEQADDSSATVTQKKTLKIKRKGGVPAADTDFPEGVELTPISDFSGFSESGGTGALTAVAGIAAILAAIVMLLLTICMGAQAIGPAAGKNNLASIRLGNMELPWPGKIMR